LKPEITKAITESQQIMVDLSAVDMRIAQQQEKIGKAIIGSWLNNCQTLENQLPKMPGCRDYWLLTKC
jgi:hypothetical protein